MATPMNCTFNTVNGENTGAYCRTGTSSSFPIPPGSTNGGILMRKHCNNATFQVDKDDGSGAYYRLINHTQYEPFRNVDANTKVYMYLGTTSGSSSSFLSSIDRGVTSTAVNTTAATSTDVVNANANDVSSLNYSEGLDAAITNMLSNVRGADTIDEGIRYIGAPFSFLATTDYRPWPDSVNLGRKYIENIVAEAPLVYLVPGHSNYLPEMDKKNREIIENYVEARNSGGEVSQDVMNKINEEEGRYYDFVANYSEYMRYVNMLCRVCAVYMGIEDRNVPGTDTKYKNYDWSRYVNNKSGTDSAIKGSTKAVEDKNFLGRVWDNVTGAVASIGDTLEEEIFGDYRYLKLYVDPSASFSESSSNSTSQSMLEPLFTQATDAVREAQFIMGGVAADVTTKVSDILKEIGSSMGMEPGKTSNIGRIIGMGDNIITGSNIIFPDLWSGSKYQKSYSLTLNLISPYGDPESIFLNIIMPMMHIIALAFPRQTTANGFTSPFIIKGFSKGWWSIELGIVDNISIEKGGQGDAWSVDGLPLEAKVTISLTDLYSNLMMAKSTQPNLFFNNPSLMEYLAVTCGVDITKPNLTMKLETIVSTYARSLFDIPGNWRNNIVDGLRNKISSMFKIF